MEEYDIGEAFKAIEDELIASMMRNLERHKAEETERGYKWSMWQSEQLKNLEAYRKTNNEKFSGEFKNINRKIESVVKVARKDGQLSQETAILKAIKSGYGAHKVTRGGTAEFFKVNDRKLNALIKATVNDMKKAEIAILRRANDQYRKIIFNAQVYANMGAGTYEKAVDMATKDFLSTGINCVEYKNGSRHTLAEYADMAIRTASKRAYLQGEGEKRMEWGISTVIMNKRGNPCPKCLPFVGKVMIDDVWSGGSSSDGPYMLMSTAIERGLYHPRCRDSHTTYFPGISKEGQPYTKEEKQEIEKQYNEEQKENYARKQAEKYGRLAEYSLDGENKKKYQAREKEWDNNCKHEESKQVNRNFRDVTNKWLTEATPNSHEIEYKHSIIYKGVKYVVDGKYVVLNPDVNEVNIAKLIKETLGGTIAIRPRVLYPQNICSADFDIREEMFDLKTPTKSGKHTLYNMIHKKKMQANNFIFDISQSGLSIEQAVKQIEHDIYNSEHTSFVDKVILIKDYEIKKIYERN